MYKVWGGRRDESISKLGKINFNVFYKRGKIICLSSVDVCFFLG